MGTLSKLPDEMVQNILKDVDPADLPALMRTCKEIKRVIANNRVLFRDLYLANLDEPPQKPNLVDYDWVEEIKDFVKMRKILESQMSVDEKTQHLSFVAGVASRWMETAAPPHMGPSHNVKLLTDLFESRDNQEAFFCNSTIFARARRDIKDASPVAERSKDERQLSAKLHTMYGVPIDLPTRRTRFNSAYPYACSVVYDLRNYDEARNLWGPYEDHHAKVDWERLEAIMVVLGHNLRMFTENTHGIFKPLWSVPWHGSSPDSFSPLTLGKLREQPAPPMDAMDPYNISGTWMRVVCFLDFSELFAYNFNNPMPPEGEPRGPIDTTEAIRLIIMEITVDSLSKPEEDDGKELPIVNFKGTSRSMHSAWDPNANSNIKGTVRLTKEGEVRWTSISVYQGEERWKSEGIQVGGVRSSRGVLGHWFDKDYDHHGPAGPTAFWKVSNEIDDSPSEDTDDADDTEYEELVEEGEEEVMGEIIVDVEDANFQHMLDIIGLSGMEHR